MCGGRLDGEVSAPHIPQVAVNRSSLMANRLPIPNKPRTAGLDPRIVLPALTNGEPNNIGAGPAVRALFVFGKPIAIKLTSFTATLRRCGSGYSHRQPGRRTIAEQILLAARQDARAEVVSGPDGSLAPERLRGEFA